MRDSCPPRMRRQLDTYERRVDELGELQERMIDLPFDQRHGNGIEYEMGRLQNQLAAQPPPMMKSNGVWVPRAQGLNPRSLAERKVENFEPVRAATVDGELNPETDFTPKFIIPDVVRLGDGASLTSGVQWFEDRFKNHIPKPEVEVRGFRRVSMGDWAAWQTIIDLTRFVEWVLNQASVGSCGAEGTAGAAHLKGEATGLLSQGEPQDCAPQPYFLYNVTSGGYDGGSSPSDNIALIQRLGCPVQKIRPRSVGWRKGHTQAELDDAAKHKTIEVLSFPTNDIELLGTMLLYGHPVAAGYSGHWWYMIGLLSRTQGLWMNSWGASWGNNGMSSIAFTKLRYLLCAFMTQMDASQITY